MSKVNRTVVRVQSCARDKVSHMERHNERKNEHYGNGDVDLSRANMNVHFKKCEGTYLQAFDKMVADGSISTRGHKKDGSSDILNELIFDVNTEYFESGGGYEYAKSFFESAYQMAVNEAGGEQYVLSAVLHADERNKALSEKLGHDVYHYHLHVVFIPVAPKEIKWSTRCKDPALVGTVKETVMQVSNSKKWRSDYEMDENGKQNLVYSFSLLQDRYYDHMKAAGFEGFERGERGSTTEHLSVLEYKAKQETKRADSEAKRAAEMADLAEDKQKTAADLDTAIKGKEQTAAKLDTQTEKKKKQLDSLEKKTTVAKSESAMFSEIERMGEKKTFTGNISITPVDWKKVSNLAKEGIKSHSTVSALEDRVSFHAKRTAEYKKSLEKYEGKGITDHMKYLEARQRAPRRMAETVASIMQEPPEQTEQPQKNRNVSKTSDLSR